MPELPEVETTVRGLAAFLEGERITRVTLNRADLRRPFPADLVQVMTGARVTSLGRRAKYGLVHLDRDMTMIFHLGMSGRWRIDPETPDSHDHLLLDTAAHRFALCDPRRFGSVDLVATDKLAKWPQFAALGPEPLGPGLTAAHLKTALKGKVLSIKLALLDQRIVAGLGNIYVCEALHEARISPFRPAGRISRPRLDGLARTVKAVLERAIAAGGSTLRDFSAADGALGYFQHSFRAYDREGEACANAGCGGRIRRRVQAGRSTFWCSACQR
ncbi:MAG: bifunctional DNA-formamidopyrimidine glycosylase/DNA-(apurinic or apyrimidinic site) lyase [Erythrobacter sp.]